MVAGKDFLKLSIHGKDNVPAHELIVRSTRRDRRRINGRICLPSYRLKFRGIDYAAKANSNVEYNMNRIWIFVCAVLAATPATTRSANDIPAEYGGPVSAEEAMVLIQRGVFESAKRRHRMAIAVVEPSGELVAFIRMNNAPYISIRLAQQKASTAARLRITTMALEERVLAGRTVLLSSDEVIPIGGGVPIVSNGKVIGAVGVSGGTAAEDAAVAIQMLALNKI